jgi:hypothetical protein
VSALRADRTQAAAAALAAFVVYALSAPHTIGLEDDALFVLSSYFLGIEHPPGYPLFMLAGQLFTWLPFGTIPYRVHLASALFGALTVGAAWLCARALLLRAGFAGTLPAWLAAAALGLSPVFWSQSIIAEVYTLNTFFLLVLVHLGLRAETEPRLLPWMALTFGLSLSNHYPLMLLGAPAFAILLWPLRAELLRRLPLLAWLVVLGLVPYAWLVWRSWAPLPVSFYGELETLREIWYFISRAGYAEVDYSVTAGWMDRVRYLTFMGSQLFVQFALAGTLVAAAGFAVQWRLLGRRVAAFLTLSFVMPSFVLALLLNFDYDVFRKHIFHVYPLPAYAVAALWLGVGFAWLAQHYALSRARQALAGAALAALIGAAGAYHNLRQHHEWAARYARTVLELLPKDAVVFGQGDADLLPLAYFHLIESARPDITLYQGQGLILGNRLFHPLRTDQAQASKKVAELVESRTGPVAFTLDFYTGSARIDHWLFVEVDRSSRDPKRITADVPEGALRFFEEAIANQSPSNAWIAYFQSELRRRYGLVLGVSLKPGTLPPDERTRRHLELLANDFYGALGLADGMLQNPAGFSAAAVAAHLDRARALLPSDAPKQHLAGYFLLRGVLRANTEDKRGAAGDFETALTLWPAEQNPAIEPLRTLYRDAGDTAALERLNQRAARLKRATR